MAARARGAERHPVGAADRRTLARHPRPVSLTRHLPPPLPALGAQRGVGEDPPRAGGGPAGSRQARSLGVLHRRQLRGGEKRGLCVGPTKRGKGSKLMAVADRHGLPVAVDVASASPAEVRLVGKTLDARFIEEVPERLIGDKAYDSDPLAQELGEAGIELIAPNRVNRIVKT